MDEISWTQLRNVIWRQRWFVLVVFFLCTVGCLGASYLLPKSYDASVLVSISSEVSASGQLGGVSSQIGGLASILGVSADAGGLRAVALATLQSDQLTRSYIEDKGLVQVLFSRLWDAEKGVWKESDSKKAPTVWAATKYFGAKVRSVTENAKSGLITLTIRWSDPVLAAAWANELVATTNRYLREQAIVDTQRNIEYLTQQIAGTNVVSLQQSLYGLMEAEIKKQMLARGNDEYAFKVIDPAVVAEVQASPKPKVWLMIGILLGAMVSIGLAIVRAEW